MRITRQAGSRAKEFSGDVRVAALALHSVHYNFCRVHGPLRVTLATGAGPATEPWDGGDLLKVACRHEPSGTFETCRGHLSGIICTLLSMTFRTAVGSRNREYDGERRFRMPKRCSDVTHKLLGLTVWACALATLASFATLGGRAADVSDHSPITSDSGAVQVPIEQVRREMAMHGSRAIAPFIGSALTSEFGILHTTLEVLSSAEVEAQYTFTFRGAHGQPLLVPVEQSACASCSAWQYTGQGTVSPNGQGDD